MDEFRFNGNIVLKKETENEEKIRYLIAVPAVWSNPEDCNACFPKKNQNEKAVYCTDDTSLVPVFMIEKEKEKVEYRVLSLYDVVQNRKHGLEDISKQITVKDKTYTLSLVLKKGDLVLLYKDNVEELRELDRIDISKRLYEIVSFEGEKGLSLIQSNCAKSYTELGKGSSLKNFELIDKIRCSVNTLKFLVRGKDFELTTDGNIKFL